MTDSKPKVLTSTCDPSLKGRSHGGHSGFEKVEVPMGGAGTPSHDFSSNLTGLRRRRSMTSASKALKRVFLNLTGSKVPRHFNVRLKTLFRGTT
jgi:hypothetical protein